MVCKQLDRSHQAIRLNMSFRSKDTNQTPSAPGNDESNPPKPSGNTADSRAVSVGKSNWKSTTYSTSKLAINLMKGSSDGFPPLKSVSRGLSAILDHCEVRHFTSDHDAPIVLTAILANNPMLSDDRIPDNSGRTAGGVIRCPHSRECGRGVREKEDPRTVTCLLQH